MKKIISLIISATLLVLALSGCAQNNVVRHTESNLPDDKISITTTIFPLYDFTRAIIGGKADLSMLVKPGAEIHSYDPSPSDIIKIQNSDVFIYVGGENDHWVDEILKSMDTSSKKIIRLMDYVTALEEETVEGMEAEEHEGEEHNDEEIEYDEHIWTSPKNAILMINTITDTLCEIDSNNAESYRQNSEAYTAQIKDVQNEIKSISATSKSKLLVFGDRFPFRYFAEEFELDYRAAFNGCSTETEASAATLAYLINVIKQNNISYIYCIELSNQSIAKAISEQTGAQILLLNSCQNISKYDFDAGTTYLSLMKQNAESLRKGLN